MFGRPGLVSILIIGIVSVGCSRDGGGEPPRSSDTDTVTDAGVGTDAHEDSDSDGPAEVSTASEDERGTSDLGAPSLFEAYGKLSTLAGTCLIEKKGVNGWKADFEGMSATGAELSRPHFAMADDAGNIYIADKDAHSIRKILTDGAIVTVAGTGASGNGKDGPGPGTEIPLASPNGLWVRGDGTVYILDLGNSKVRRLTPSGVMTTLFLDVGGISLGRSVWMNDDETLCYFSSGTAVKKWTPEDGVTVSASGFSGLGALTVDPDGHVVAADRSGNRVYRIGVDGEKSPFAGTGSSVPSGGDGTPALDTALHGVRGVWFLNDGSYFLATHEGSQVWYVDVDGIIHLFLDGLPNDVHAGDGESFDTPGPKISEVRGISVDASGNVIITENDCGYIRKVERKP